MKTIYLLRHAKSSWDDPGLADIDRPLAGRGKQARETMAGYLAEKKLRPALILCSPAKRARSTLKAVRAALGPEVAIGIDAGLYGTNADGLLRRIRGLDDETPSVMLIGHNPEMEELALGLAGAGDAEARARMAAKFPTAALAVLRSPSDHWRGVTANGCRLEAFVRPRDLN